MAAAVSLSLTPPPPPLPPPRHTRRGRAAPTGLSSTSAPSPPPSALLEIQKSGVIACLRANDRKLAVEAARAALRGGISVLEVVMSTSGAAGAASGIPFIDDWDDAKKAVKIGAKFLMSPGTVMEILFDVQGSDILYIPGAMTPNEVLSAYNAGARAVKVYPVSMLGGEKYISVLKKPFPHIPMVASQGITIDSIGRYIERGASAVVLSDAIFEKNAMEQGNFDAVSRFAHVATLHAHRAGKHLPQGPIYY